MPKLFDREVSEDFYQLNKHYLETPKLPKTDVEKAIKAEQRKALERRFDDLWLRCGGEVDFWLDNYLFDADKDWHIDRYNETYRIGVEIHGGQWAKKGESGHRNPSGFQRDWEKLLRCTELGIVLVALTTAMVSAAHVERVVRIVEARKHASAI